MIDDILINNESKVIIITFIIYCPNEFSFFKRLQDFEIN